MKLICLIVVLCLGGCATCSSSDTYEQCRTKERDKQQRNSAGAIFTAPGKPTSA
jgi:uncharacterized protein YceK